MKIIGKMELVGMEDNHGQGKKVEFETRYSPELPEDQRFTKYTPYGKMMQIIDNPEALKHLEVGKKYLISIEEYPG